MLRGLFLHHSVGQQLLREGQLRERLAQRLAARLGAGSAPVGRIGLELWDHDYNAIGFSDGTGRPVGRSLPMPGDDTDPAALLRLFASTAPAADPDAGAQREQLRAFDLIMMKSCYPNSAIDDDEAFVAARSTYAGLLDALVHWPGTAFVLLTSPPLTPRHTRPDQAERAARLARWLVTGPVPANVRVFDLRAALAQPEGPQAGMLRREYRRRWRVDSHPNRRGSAAAAQALADYLAVELDGLASSLSGE